MDCVLKANHSDVNHLFVSIGCLKDTNCDDNYCCESIERLINAFVWLTAVAFVSNVIYYVIVYKMPSLWRSSFSYGELFIVSHCCVAFVSTSGACVVTKLFNPSLSYMFCSTHTPTLVLQVLRVRRVPLIYRSIESVFDKFRDQKDSGFLTLTHIYLLIGCSLPLWISPSNGISIASGVISVGLGDTAAAVGGSLFGRNRWRGSHKTYEGTFFAFIAQLMSSLFLVWAIRRLLSEALYLVETVGGVLIRHMRELSLHLLLN
ncbi:unnamed protein product [Oppiella nova]|uniref:dolichol kinase n=1 Tax=Oppiella nova TaxID=334625 RepID=A0A7R9M550_9ACAR|nr:unnamed protein product [Oppiella nova]CAG2170443.1 unnamed protein product [Oppiella nova]